MFVKCVWGIINGQLNKRVNLFLSVFKPEKWGGAHRGEEGERRRDLGWGGETGDGSNVDINTFSEGLKKVWHYICNFSKPWQTLNILKL